MNDIRYADLTAKDIAEKLINLAKEDKKLLIIAHRNPDGDAVGSAFALKSIYGELGAKAVCICSDNIPGYLRFLLRDQTDIIFDENETYDAITAVDTASPDQMGDLSFLADRIEFAIDHHESCTPYCDTYRDKDSSAAGELIYDIYEFLVKEKIIEKNADISRLIYAAISADTGSFKYSNTTKRTHIIASKLIDEINSDKNGINTAEISRLLHNSRSLTQIKAEKLCIENLHLAENGKIAYIVLNRSEYTKYGLEENDFGSAVDIPRSIENVLLSFVIKESRKSERDKKVYKISTRSSCNINVSDICEKFGGGGHAKAAGAGIEAENEESATKMILAEFIKALKGEN